MCLSLTKIEHVKVFIDLYFILYHCILQTNFFVHCNSFALITIYPSFGLVVNV